MVNTLNFMWCVFYHNFFKMEKNKAIVSLKFRMVCTFGLDGDGKGEEPTSYR